jgi:anthranilate synthase component 1
MMERHEWIARAADGGVVPVVHECLLDLDQPVTVLARLARGPFAFLLESAVGGERWARFTFLGTEPAEAWRYRGRMVERWTAPDGWRAAGETADPIGHIGGVLRGRPVAHPEGLPPFAGGAIGFVGYDVVRTLERLGEGPRADHDLPDALFLITDLMIVLDNLRNRASIVANVELPPAPALAEREAAWDAAQARIAAWLERLRGPSGLAPLSADAAADEPRGLGPYAAEAFTRDVAVLKEHIAAGDIFQAVLSRRLEVEGAVDPLTLYRCLRSLNPAPYLYYLALDGFSIVGSSPEVLVRVEDREVTVRPIAGTRPRGASDAEDAALAADLLRDPKELAEHQMLVDLGRNDVGRVAAYGSVRLAERLVIERYAHVQHIASEVRGTLAEGMDAVDALKACFPAGTVTGAPKVRAMQLLDALEPTRRGPYAGAVGYLGWGARRMDTAIAIRTCVVLPDRVLVQAGAGIVADSDPAKELAETGHKARAALRAIGMARRAGADR